MSDFDRMYEEKVTMAEARRKAFRRGVVVGAVVTAAIITVWTLLFL